MRKSKYNSLTEWREKNPTVYNAARRRNFLEEIYKICEWPTKINHKVKELMLYEQKFK